MPWEEVNAFRLDRMRRVIYNMRVLSLHQNYNHLSSCKNDLWARFAVIRQRVADSV